MTDRAKDSNEIMNRFIMVANEDTKELVYISLLLQRFQYHVCTAKTAAEALAMIAIAPPVLVVTSQFLPDMSGYDLFLRLKLDPRTSEVPVIVITHAGDLLTAQRFREAGAAACLDTPVHVEKLYPAVQAAIESRPRRNLRITTILPVTVNGVLLSTDAGECTTVLSEHGMYIRTLKPSAANTRLIVTILVKNRLVSVDAVVLYTYGHGQGLFKEPGMGLKFVRIDPEDREFIRQYIREEITKGVAPSTAGRPALPDNE
jgi:CheY-like chemotaxis protein